MPADHPPRPSVSSIQLTSNALAAVTAAVVGSRLGIAGTLVGAAAGSVIATTGTAMYGHWLDRTASRVRTVVRLPAARTASAASTAEAAEPTAVLVDVDQAPPEPGTLQARTRRQPTWRTVVLAAAATFAVAIGSITAFEAIVGEPVSTLTGGEAGSGTTLGRVVDSGTAPDVGPEPVPTSTPVPTTSPTSSPSPSETPTPTETSTPSQTSPAPTPTSTSPEPTTPPPDPDPSETSTPR